MNGKKEMENVYVLDGKYKQIKNLVRDVRDKRNRGYELWTKVFDLGRAEGRIMLGKKIAEIDPVPIYILRAGEPLKAGINTVYQSGKAGFIAAKRDEDTLDIETHYVSIPDIDGADIILADSMLATGGSILAALEVLRDYDMPRTITVVTGISSEYGIKEIMKKHGDEITLFTGTMSSETVPDGIGPGLNARGYILNPEGEPRDLGDDIFGTPEKLKKATKYARK